MAQARTERTQSWIPLLILVATLALLIALWKILVVFLLAALFAFVVYPLVKLFDKKLPRAVSIVCVYLVIGVILFIVLGVIVPIAIQEFEQLIKSVPTYIEKAREVIVRLQTQYTALPGSLQGIIDDALVQLQQTAMGATQQAIPTIISVFTGVVTLLLVPVLAFFMLLGCEGYGSMIRAVTPARHRRTMSELLDCAGRSLWHFVRGELILMAAVGTLTGLGLYAVGMPYAIAFGVLAGLLEIIPNVGPFITTVVVGLTALFINPVLAIWAVGVTLAVQALENTIIVPIVIGQSVGLSPVTVIFSVILGGSIGGVIGALVAIPMALMVKIVILYFYAEQSDLPSKQRQICRPPRRPPPKT